jgi:hypothetical protein
VFGTNNSLSSMVALASSHVAGEVAFWRAVASIAAIR